MCSCVLMLPIPSIKLKQAEIFILQLHCGMLTIEIRNVHNYIYNIGISTLKGIHIAYSEGRVGGNQILLHCIPLGWHQNHLRTDLADKTSNLQQSSQQSATGSSSLPPPPLNESQKLFCIR